MVRIRRGGYVFVVWKGDHPPRHVHVYRDRVLLLRWNLEAWKPLSRSRTPSLHVSTSLIELRREGRL
jgi:hypothetical protein